MRKKVGEGVTSGKLYPEDFCSSAAMPSGPLASADALRSFRLARFRCAFRAPDEYPVLAMAWRPRGWFAPS